MIAVMMNVTQVIEALGGYKRTCTLLGISRSLLVAWEREGIPARRWHQIAEVAALSDIPGITVETLCHVVPSKVGVAA